MVMVMRYLIREAIIEDKIELSKLMSELTTKDISSTDIENRLEFVSSSPYDWLYVYEEDESILETLGFRIRENIEEIYRYGEISVIVVSNQAKRKGIGRILMDFADKLAIEHKCKGAWLVTGNKRVEEAHKFYKALGFEETGVRFVKTFKRKR
jgi:ribosomal protein S18 acetylase RimI-like enzyme